MAIHLCSRTLCELKQCQVQIYTRRSKTKVVDLSCVVSDHVPCVTVSVEF